MGRACGMHGTEKLWEYLRERDRLEEQSVDGKLLKHVAQKESMDKISVVPGRDKWQAVVNMVINLWVA
jgi:hypothetical protein